MRILAVFCAESAAVALHFADLSLSNPAMQLLIDFLPNIVFFGTYQVAGIYAATTAIIIAMAAQIAIQWIRTRTVNKMLLVSGILVAVFGGVTLAFRDPIFIQWKPTIVNLLFAGAFLASRFIGEKTLIERIMGHAIELDTAMWKQLNGLWISNFAFLAAANLYVVYNFDEEAWVKFKLFGMLGLTLAMVFIQAIWIAVRTADREHHDEDPRRESG